MRASPTHPTVRGSPFPIAEPHCVLQRLRVQRRSSSKRERGGPQEGLDNRGPDPQPTLRVAVPEATSDGTHCAAILLLRGHAIDI